MRTIGVVALLALSGGAFAKMPPPTEAAKAAAAEAAAKSAWTEKVGAYQLCQAQDRVAAKYRATATAAGKPVPPPGTAQPCVNPGPFAYTPEASKPLEVSGAHSPPGNAISPPSNNATAADHAGGIKQK